MAEGRVRVGVVGAGFIGPAHVESLRRLGFVDVVALAGRGRESAAQKAAELFIPKAYGDYLELIADPEVDVVEICSPNLQHFPRGQGGAAGRKARGM